MAEIAPPVQLKCDGCNRYYSDRLDLAPIQVGSQRYSMCRRCHQTATGPGWGRTFEADQELSGMNDEVVARPATAAKR